MTNQKLTTDERIARALEEQNRRQRRDQAWNDVTWFLVGLPFLAFFGWLFWTGIKIRYGWW